MTGRESYAPGPAGGASVRQEGERWTLVLVRELRHPPGDGLGRADRSGTAPRMGAVRRRSQPRHHRAGDAFDRGLAHAAGLGVEGHARAQAPRLLEFSWGANDMRWELEPLAGGTRLTLWHNIGRRFVAMGAAGWHICFDVLDRFAGGPPDRPHRRRRCDEVRLASG